MFKLKLSEFQPHTKGKWIGQGMYILRLYKNNNLSVVGIFFGSNKYLRKITQYGWTLEDQGVEFIHEIKRNAHGPRFWGQQDVATYKKQGLQAKCNWRESAVKFKHDVYDIMYSVKVEQQKLEL